MERFCCRVTFIKKSGTEYLLDFITEFETEESYENLTDTFNITFPRNLNLKGRPLFNETEEDTPLFERGDRIKVEAGYYPDYRTIFEGWVTEISAKIPVTIKCEDDMWLLKNTSVTYPSKEKITVETVSKKSGKPLKRPRYHSPEVKLKELLDELLSQGAADIEYAEPVLDVNLGQFRVSNSSITKVLEVLHSKFGLFSYFRDGKLYVGLPSNAADTKVVDFKFERNIISDENLQYQLAKDISLKVVAKLIGNDNTYEEVEVGDTDGAQRSYFMYWNGTDKKPSLKDFATMKLEESKYDGYRGSFTTFGEPYVRHGDVVNLSSLILPERDGKYLVTTVRRNASVSGGYRQEVEIGQKVK